MLPTEMKSLQRHRLHALTLGRPSVLLKSFFPEFTSLYSRTDARGQASYGRIVVRIVGVTGIAWGS